jgi:6-phosphofructokinase 1
VSRKVDENKKEVAGKLRVVTPDDNLILQGKRIGISFGISEE